jgi:hypothetical protein
MLDTEQAWEVFEKLDNAHFAPQPPALPAETLPRDVRAAINRRAHAMSLRRYDRIRDDLTAAVRRHVKRFPEDHDLVSFVEGVDLLDSVLVAVHRDDLWGVTSRVMAVQTLKATGSPVRTPARGGRTGPGGGGGVCDRHPRSPDDPRFAGCATPPGAIARPLADPTCVNEGARGCRGRRYPARLRFSLCGSAPLRLGLRGESQISLR